MNSNVVRYDINQIIFLFNNNIVCEKLYLKVIRKEHTCRLLYHLPALVLYNCFAPTYITGNYLYLPKLKIF